MAIPTMCISTTLHGEHSSKKLGGPMSRSASIYKSWRVCSANARRDPGLSQRYESESVNSARRNVDDEKDVRRMRQASASFPDKTLSRMHPLARADSYR